MALKRTIVCDVCGLVEAEGFPNGGFPGWGHVAGVALNGVENPTLCPSDLGAVADFTDQLRTAKWPGQT